MLFYWVIFSSESKPEIKELSTILSRVFGTLMVWFTHKRLTNLQEQVNEVKNEQHRLLQIQRVTLARLDALEQVLREVVVEMEKSENTWVNYFALCVK